MRRYRGGTARLRLSVIRGADAQRRLHCRAGRQRRLCRGRASCRNTMALTPNPDKRGAAILDAVRHAARQEQFLEVVSPEEAHRRFESCIDLSPFAAETVPLAAALTRV